MNKKIHLVLENGRTFTGTSVGALGETVGELVFTTSMGGYNDILTDPSYYGQIVIHTFPISGCYGVISEEFAGKSTYLKAYIVKDICDTPSNFRTEGTLPDFMKEKGIIGLCDIDTRELTKILREYGTINAKITSDISNMDSILEELKKHKEENLVEKVSSNKSEVLKSDMDNYNVILWDFGAKESLKSQLLSRGYNVIVMPHNSTADEIISHKPDGIVISNGPGDPSENIDAVSEIRKIVDSKIPVFGICLGHQLLALSQGAKTMKLKYGHRGSNQPTKSIENGRVYITSQNHGYVVEESSLPKNATSNFVNVNDGTCEGLEYKSIPAFSVQFYPDCCCGPNNTGFLFDKFENIMKGDKK